MNSVSFLGRSNVIYGMEQAAKFVRKAEQAVANSSGPRPILDQTSYAKNTSVANAYLDMVTRDDQFVYTLKHYENNNEHSKASLAATLKKNNIGLYKEIKPFEPFKQMLFDNTQKNCPKDVFPIVQNFINQISEKIH